MQTSRASFNSPKNIVYRIAMSAFLLSSVLALPIGVSGWFDGLPWVGRLETLVVIIVVPAFLLLGWRFLSLYLSKVFLLILLSLKIFLFVSAPAGGWLIKIKPDMPVGQFGFSAGFCGYFDLQFPNICKNRKLIENKNWFEVEWAETYATFWNKEASSILKEPWTNKFKFPLDWTIPLKPKSFDEISPTIKINGAILLADKYKFAVVAEGLREGSLLGTNENGESFVLSPAKSIKEAAQDKYHFPMGKKWKLSGDLKYEGKKWSLIPVLVGDNGIVTSSLSRDILWQNKYVFSMSSWKVQLFKSLSWAVDLGICMFFLVWGFWMVRFQIQEHNITPPLILFSSLAVLIPILLASPLEYMLGLVHIADLTKVSYLGISIVMTATGFLLWSYLRNDFRGFCPDRMGCTIAILFGPALILFFASKWWFELGQWWQWIPGDDWTSYQYFGRRIMVGGEWLTGGESSLLGRELYPYVTAIFHGLFGQSSFSQRMLDVWSVLCATSILASLAIKFRLTPFVAFITSTTFLMIYLIGAFRYHIGRSLSETLAMVFMMIAIWFLCKARDGNYITIATATIFGILSYWTRQDHLGVIAGLAFLTLEPVVGSVGGWKGYWTRFKLAWQPLIWYWTGGIFIGVFFLCLRNWFIGAGFILAGRSPNFGHSDVFSLFKSMYLILTGNYWPNVPSISGVVITFGTLIGLMSLVWHRKPLMNFPVSIGIAMLGLLMPYMFMQIWAYAPRFSIHLLPLALFSTMIFLDQFLKENPTILKFNSQN